MKKDIGGLFASIAFLMSIVFANALTDLYGVVPIGLGMTATAGTVVAGVAFVARDIVQDLIGPKRVLWILATGIFVSIMVASPELAFASAVAFGVSELADTLVYTPLRTRGYIKAATASNMVGVVVDTFLFLWLAGFSLNSHSVVGQLVAKIAVTIVAILGVVIFRDLLRNKKQRQRA